MENYGMCNDPPPPPLPFYLLKLLSQVRRDGLRCRREPLTFMHSAVFNGTVAVGSTAATTDKQRGGEGRRGLAQRERETGALISGGLTGCVDRAVAPEEEAQREDKLPENRSKAQERNAPKEREGERRERGEITEGREVIRSRERERVGSGSQGHGEERAHREAVPVGREKK